MIESYINNIKFCYNNTFSIEDKIRDLFGEVCFHHEHPFVKRFKRQINLMEKFSKQEEIIPKRDGYRSYKRQKAEMSNIARHYPVPGPISFKDRILLDIGSVNPKNKEAVNKYARDVIAYATRLENVPKPAILRVIRELR